MRISWLSFLVIWVIGFVACFVSSSKYPSRLKNTISMFLTRLIIFVVVLLCFFGLEGVNSIGAIIEAKYYDDVCYATVKGPATNNFESKAIVLISAYHYAPHRKHYYEIEWISLNYDDVENQKTFYAYSGDRTTIKNVFDWQTFTDKYKQTWQVKIHCPYFSIIFNLALLLFWIWPFFTVWRLKIKKNKEIEKYYM